MIILQLGSRQEKNKSSQCYQELKGNNGACQFLLSVGTEFDEKAQLHKRGKGVTATDTDGEGLAFPEVSVKVTFLDHLLRLATCQFLDYGPLR